MKNSLSHTPLFRSIILIAALLACHACTKGNLDILGMFYTLSPNADQRFAESREYNEQHGVDTIYVAQNNYKVYVMTDIHVDSTTFNLGTFATTYIQDDGAAPFCLCLGDQINAVNNYPKFFAHIDRIRAAGKKVYSTVGNHDIYYNQWSIYRDYWHTSSFYFVVVTPSGATDFYLFLDSSDGTFGTDLRQWAESTLRAAAAAHHRHIIVATHTHFWKLDQRQGHTSNFALEETYEMADMFAKNHVDIVLQGHSHYRSFNTFKGVKYLRLDKMEDHYYNAFYTIFQIGSDIQWSFIPVGPQKDGAFEDRVPGL